MLDTCSPICSLSSFQLLLFEQLANLVSSAFPVVIPHDKTVIRGLLSANKRFPYGYDRAEVLGAMISVIILWVLTTILVLLAIERIVNNDYEVKADTMLITAGVGVGFNIIMAIVLHLGSAGHAHSHGGVSHGLVIFWATLIRSFRHSHGGVGGNVNVRAALIHVIGDLIQSIGVLVAALVIKVYESNFARLTADNLVHGLETG